RFDYLTMDDEDHYLLSAHLGPGILYVIDVRTNQLVKSIPDVPGITGLEYVPGLHKVYTSDWGEEKIGVVDLRTMSVIKRLPTAEKPNGSTYATHFRKMYVSNTVGKAVAIVDVRQFHKLCVEFLRLPVFLGGFDGVHGRSIEIFQTAL